MAKNHQPDGKNGNYKFFNEDEKNVHKNNTFHQIKYLNLSMRDQVDSDITFFLYTSIDFIERAL